MAKGIHEGSIFSRQEKRTVAGKTHTVTQWYARVRYTGLDGLPTKRNAVPPTAEATRLKATLGADIAKELNPGDESLTKTFADLCTHYRKEYLKPAEYRDGRKVASQRSYKSTVYHLTTLRTHPPGVSFSITTRI